MRDDWLGQFHRRKASLDFLIGAEDEKMKKSFRLKYSDFDETRNDNKITSNLHFCYTELAKDQIELMNSALHESPICHFMFCEGTECSSKQLPQCYINKNVSLSTEEKGTYAV